MVEGEICGGVGRGGGELWRGRGTGGEYRQELKAGYITVAHLTQLSYRS